MKQSKKMLAMISTVVVVITLLVSSGISASAASDLFVVQDFESYATGTELTVEEADIGHLAGEVIPTVSVVENKSKTDSNQTSGDKKGLQVVTGDSKGKLDTFQQIRIMVPADKQNWSAYKDGYIVHHLDCSKAVVNQAIQIFLVDKDGETYGFKTNFEKGWVWPRQNKGKWIVDNQGTNWGGVGFGNWFSYYYGIQLTEDVYIRLNDNPTANGNQTLDWDGIQQIIFRLDSGVNGVNKGDTITIDNFFLAKKLTIDEKSSEMSADGIKVVKYFADRSAAAPAPSKTTAAPAKTTTAPAQKTNAASQADATTQPSGDTASTTSVADGNATETSGSVSDTTETQADNAVGGTVTTQGGTTAPATNDNESEGMPGWAIALIVVAVVVILGVAGFFGYRAYAKKNSQDSAE